MNNAGNTIAGNSGLVKHGHRFIDITGQRFGRLLIVSYHHSHKKKSFWLCRCDCGVEKIIYGGRIKQGEVKSCGCLRIEVARARTTTHGDSESPEFKTWNGMKYRCADRDGEAFKYHGHRGIRACVRWLQSFENFFEDMGRKPSPKHSIERRDVNGDYEPSNCYWATNAEQSVNRRNNFMVEHNGETKTLKEWSVELGFHYKNIHSRMKRRGMNFQEAISKPFRKKRIARPESAAIFQC